MGGELVFRSFGVVALVLRALFAIEFVASPGWFTAAGGALFTRCPSRPGRGEPGGSSLFFASPKKSNQKKGDPQSGTPSGQPVNLAKTGGPRKLAALKQRAALIPFFAKFTGPARTGFGGNADAGTDAGAGSALIPAFTQIEKEQDRSANRLICISPLSRWERAGAERCGSRCACAHLESVKKRLLCRSCGLQDSAPRIRSRCDSRQSRSGWAEERRSRRMRARACLSASRVCT